MKPANTSTKPANGPSARNAQMARTALFAAVDKAVDADPQH